MGRNANNMEAVAAAVDEGQSQEYFENAHCMWRPVFLDALNFIFDG